MRVWRAVVLTLFGVVLLFGFIAPGAAPLSVTSPVSDSMEPTAPQHSLVVVTSGGVTTGDILLFETPERDRSVLHRAVGEADTGYITQGDANELPDQAFGMTPVSPDQIDGSVLTIAGHPVIIPYVGGVLTNPVVLLGLWGLLALSLLYTTQLGGVSRGSVATTHIRKYAVVLALIIVVAIPVTTGLSAITVQTEIVTSTTASPSSPSIAAPGDVSERTVSVSSPFFALLHTPVVVEGDVTLQDTSSSNGGRVKRITVQNNPSNVPTVHEGSVTVYTYPRVLPGAVMKPIDTIHPVLGSFVSSLVIAGLLVGASRVFDKHRIVRGTRDEIRAHRDNRARRDEG